ncbi:hypothetical protein DRJ25_05520 [Candidatus Woesearchaeota archaeon]|nr:MAG: hypothetical protein DRJ25_05520 [Candidatus Woesearchaeota archaeon]
MLWNDPEQMKLARDKQSHTIIYGLHDRTEGGLYVQSPALAKRIISYMNEGINLKNAYRFELDKTGHITWITMENGKEIIYTSEPKVGVWDKMKVNFLQMLPLEDQL